MISLRRSIEPLLPPGWLRAPGRSGTGGIKGAAMTISIRPSGSASAMPVCRKSVTRIFQGNHWLFQCESECGRRS